MNIPDPKEKAIELHKKMWNAGKITMAGAYHIFRDLGRDLAIIAVAEILKNDSVGMSTDFNHLVCDTDWWQQVKEELLKL